MSKEANTELEFPILRPYQIRVLSCLVSRPHFIAELNELAGVSHSPMAVKELREKGVEIDSPYLANPLKTPTRRQVVRYELNAETLDFAKGMLKQNLDARTSTQKAKRSKKKG